jgi:hypothetical protein
MVETRHPEAFGGDHVVVDLDEKRADEPDDTRVGDFRAGSPRTMIGRTLARATVRVDLSR